MYQVRGHPACILPHCTRCWRTRARRQKTDPVLHPRLLVLGFRFSYLPLSIRRLRSAR